MAKYLKNGNNLLRKDTTTGIISVIEMIDIIGLDGTTTGVKNLTNYDPSWPVPAGYIPATEAEWDYAAMKLIRFIATLG